VTMGSYALPLMEFQPLMISLIKLPDMYNLLVSCAEQPIDTASLDTYGDVLEHLGICLWMHTDVPLLLRIISHATYLCGIHQRSLAF
jgi:hypothetical protein